MTYSLLETITTRNGLNLNIYYSKTVKETPAVIPLLQANIEVLQKKMSGGPNRLIFSNSDQVLWAENKEDIASVLCFRPYISPDGTDDKIMLRLLSYTDPKLRGLGIRPLLQKYFEQICLEQDYDKIISFIHIDNKSSKSCALKEGLVPVMEGFYKKISK